MSNEFLYQALISELDYNPQTGQFFRKTKRGGRPIGSLAGHKTKAGYVELNVCGARIHAHRAAWLYTHGTMPSAEIDHINRVRWDNRIENLRDVGRSDNALNVSMRKSNTSGHTGVYWHKPSKGWVVMLQRNCVQQYIGYFKDVSRAVEARDAWLRSHSPKS